MELKEYLLPLRRWWWLLLAATVIAVAASYLITSRQAPIYQARVTLLVGRAIENPNPSGNEFFLTQQLATTYTDIAKRSTVRRATAKALNIKSVPDYGVRVVPNTQLMEIVVTDSNPERAAAVANELAKQLILQTPTASDQTTQDRQAFINNQLDDLQVKITDTQQDVAKKQEELGGLFSARQIADTQAQITGLQQKLNSLQSNYAALLANTQRGALNQLSVIEAAQPPNLPIGPDRLIIILLAAAVGFVMAAAAAYLLEYLDDTFKSPDMVQKTLGLTTLGAVPVMDEVTPGNELAPLINDHSATTEAYRVLRTNLQFASVDRPLHTLMVTSPAPSEGKSMTSANLAAAVARAGRQVILVDADLHRPRLHRVFNLTNNVGVTSALLADHPSVEGLLQETQIPGLRVLTAGPLPPNPAELLGSSRMKDLIAALNAHADMVILDTPPVVALADAAILSTHTDGVLLVLDAAHTRREVARRALASLGQVKARVIGVLLNRVPTRGAGYYYYNYYYYGRYTNGRDGDSAGQSGRRRNRRRFGRGRAAAPVSTSSASRSASQP
ncbi:MAG: polysaccharide biosynthesis tyrosine autokinase [Anaerolineae bacterium]|uniref:polysaccharide biosynthesis tyrosine autokinase n=2 Tax=Candidatus Amarolinea dominans TaxID=3140696 RepID=UPI001E084251|nr:polysaccharide biosynthesis tyrosine autokinase [Anaerolineae bacterium]MBK7199810.1 polysaccharide biosynthesis tyrosine autokinase [Anaerolineae bacterium]MBK9093915.1 polysaccharide biosynthesis tyrosine autokinase [Anaerolineae bacterium]